MKTKTDVAVNEQFAEKADKKFRELFPEINNYLRKDKQIGINTAFPALMIKMHCLSKQRVKESIKRAFSGNHVTNNKDRMNYLLKELGLIDE